MTDRQALLNAILADPADDAPRLIYADWLDEHAGDVACEDCNGQGWLLPEMKLPNIKYKLDADGRTVAYVDELPPLNVVHPKCPSCVRGRVSNGFAERAEFIRVQVELSKGPMGRRWYDLRYSFGKEWDGLRARQQQLLVHHHHEMFDLPFRSESGQNAYAVQGTDLIAIHNQRLTFTRGFISQLTLSWSDCERHLDKILEEHPVERVEIVGNWPDGTSDFYSGRWPKVSFTMPTTRTNPQRTARPRHALV